MRFILILLTLLLTAAWFYTSWYWYTCNIKGFCDRSISSVDSRIEQAKAKLITGNDVIVDTSTQEETVQTESVTNELQRVIINEEAAEQPADEATKIIVDTGTSETTSTSSLCSTPLVGPIEFGKNNNTDQVKLLEEFLISRGENVEIDGTYEQDDFEAVKRFQLEFKQEILDPWGVTAPTGFVFRTTVKKINELACN